MRPRLRPAGNRNPARMQGIETLRREGGLPPQARLVFRGPLHSPAVGPVSTGTKRAKTHGAGHKTERAMATEEPL
jgi:hypothetical protein